MLTLPGWRGSRKTFTVGDDPAREVTDVVEYLRADWWDEDYTTYAQEKRNEGLRSQIVFEMWNRFEDSDNGYYNMGLDVHSVNGKIIKDLLLHVLSQNQNLNRDSENRAAFNLLSHSMGGVYSRYYFSKLQGDGCPRVRSFVALAPPNAGVSIRIPPVLCPEYMSIFSVCNPPPEEEGWQWILLAGTRGYEYSPEGKPNDYVVGTWSVKDPDIAYPDQEVLYQEIDETHESIHETRATIIQVTKWLEERDLPPKRAHSNRAPDKTLAQELASVVATNSQPAYHVVPMLVDDAASASFCLQWTSGEIETEIRKPSGALVSLTKEVLLDAAMMRIYDLATPFELGSYDVKVKGVSGLPVDGELIGISLVFSDGPTIEAWPEFNNYRWNDTVWLFAYSDDGLGVPFPGPAVVARVTDPKGASFDVDLRDDGQHNDGTANDGTYGGSFVAIENGRHSIKAIASGQKPSTVPFDRHALTSFDVAMGTGAFCGNYSDYGEDLNDNQTFDVLKLDVDVDVAAGNYELRGVLCGGVNMIAEAAVSLAAGSSGVQTVTLTFDGATIHRCGADGPYLLSLLEVYDEDNGLILEDAIANAHTTQSYLYTDFDAPPPPVLTSVSPNWGPWNGGTEIVLSGRNLAEDSLVVRFNDYQAEDVEVLSPGVVKVTVPNIFWLRKGGGKGRNPPHVQAPGRSASQGGAVQTPVITVAITAESAWGSSTLGSCYTYVY